LAIVICAGEEGDEHKHRSSLQSSTFPGEQTEAELITVAWCPGRGTAADAEDRRLYIHIVSVCERLADKHMMSLT
jgi:hypothetical protein